jgi:transposase
VEEFFTDYLGYLHCDGYPGYDAFASKNRKIKLVGCLYQARRKFVEIAKLAPNKEGVVAYVVKWIAELAHIEESIKTLATDDRYRIRLQKSKPILDRLQCYLQENQPTIPPKSLLGQAVSYTLNQWSKIITYLDDGRLEISNNRSERRHQAFCHWT